MTVRPATFDPLDAHLWEAYEHVQNLPDSLRADLYQHTVWIDPKHWEKYKPPSWVFNLEWHTYRYSEVDTVQKLKTVAKKDVPGIYLFSIRPDHLVGEFPCYALYIGISNANNSGRFVWQRLADYLPKRLSQIKKRGAVHRMIAWYFGALWVHFAYVNEPSSTLSQIEKTLHGYLAPPVSSRDYPVDMKPGKKAF